MARDSYPSSVYSGIHPDDEDSWGMCCSYEAACRCAEEHYNYEHQKDKEFILKLIVGVVIALVVFIIGWNILGKWMEDHPLPEPVTPTIVCEGCGLEISPDDGYYEFLDKNFHFECLMDVIGDQVMVHNPK